MLLIILFFYRFLLQDSLLVSDDYEHHAVRTANYYLALRQGQLPVRWGPNLNDGLGYPSFNYTYHSPYIVSSAFHFIGASVQSSVNLSMLSSILVGSLGAFLLTYFLTKNNVAAITGGLIYCLNPYYLLNIYWRGALGESFFIAFVPFLFLGIHLLFNKSFKYGKNLGFILISASSAILILSHVPSLVVLTPVLISFILFYIYKEVQDKKLVLTHICLAGLIGILLTSWYWMPAFFERNYIAYNSGSSLVQYKNHFISLPVLFKFQRNINASDFFTEVLQLGFNNFVIFLFGFLLFAKAQKRSWKLFWGLFLYLLSLFFMTPTSKIIWDNFGAMQLVQFPWRLLLLIGFLSLWLFSVIFSLISKQRQLLFSLFLSLISIYIGFSYASPKGFATRSDYEWYEARETGTSFDEHKPIWSKKPYYFPEEIMYISNKNLDLLNERDAVEDIGSLMMPISALNPKITQINGTTLSYELDSELDIMVIHKRLYFPGWKTMLNNRQIDPIINVPKYEGVIALNLPQGNSKVMLSFEKRTQMRLISELISTVTFFVVFFWFGYKIVFLLLKTNYCQRRS